MASTGIYVPSAAVKQKFLRAFKTRVVSSQIYTASQALLDAGGVVRVKGCGAGGFGKSGVCGGGGAEYLEFLFVFTPSKFQVTITIPTAPTTPGADGGSAYFGSIQIRGGKADGTSGTGFQRGPGTNWNMGASSFDSGMTTPTGIGYRPGPGHPTLGWCRGSSPDPHASDSFGGGGMEGTGVFPQNGVVEIEGFELVDVP